MSSREAALPGADHGEVKFVIHRTPQLLGRLAEFDQFQADMPPGCIKRVLTIWAYHFKRFAPQADVATGNRADVNLVQPDQFHAMGATRFRF
jgi:hypothetical protein